MSVVRSPSASIVLIAFSRAMGTLGCIMSRIRLEAGGEAAAFRFRLTGRGELSSVRSITREPIETIIVWRSAKMDFG